MDNYDVIAEAVKDYWREIENHESKPMTNADRIRVMSVEELASFLWKRDMDVVKNVSKAVGFTVRVDEEQCLSNVLNWLKEDGE